jgi:hypothetical protein
MPASVPYKDVYFFKLFKGTDAPRSGISDLRDI